MNREAAFGGDERTMGFFDKVKGETQRNFIARADEAKGELVYKYPEKNIRMLTQLTVDADEVVGVGVDPLGHGAPVS